jgi:hypothetical protein
MKSLNMKLEKRRFPKCRILVRKFNEKPAKRHAFLNAYIVITYSCPVLIERLIYIHLKRQQIGKLQIEKTIKKQWHFKKEQLLKSKL